MLNIYYGREAIDKEKFIYEKIAEKQGRTLVIVPDQYTLEAEKQAFRLLHTKGLLDVEIISMSRLGSRLLAAQGGDRRTFIDKYGRHMILTRIADTCREDLQVFGGTMAKPAFLELTNNFISEMKQYEVQPADLQSLRKDLQEGSLLHRKLSDLQLIYEKYEEAIRGKYTDAEDLITLYTEKIRDAEMIAESEIWVYGFDSFAPKAISVLGQLMKTARDFHVFLTCDDQCKDEELFLLPKLVMRNLQAEAQRQGVSWDVQKIGPGYEITERCKAMQNIEKQLYSICPEPEEDSEGVTIVEAANVYSEAESAASYVLHLLRDKGLRYRDIMMICNDQSTRGFAVRRVFEEYGIEIFDDKKRTIMSSPVAIFVTGLLETAIGRYQTSDLLKFLKTGFTEVSFEEVELLENYAFQYRIRGTMWKKPFVKGVLEFGEEGLERLNEIREKATGLVEGLETVLAETRTVADFLKAYYDYLMEEIQLERYITALMEQQEAQGELDLADETRQIWGKIVALFDQIMEIMGEEPFDGRTFLQLFQTGLGQMEVGVLPPTADDLLMGTMQRTRSGEAKAVLVLGANEGVLPKNVSSEGLFSLEELEFLSEKGENDLCKTESIRVMEEQLAIYRTLCKATDYLWISYSLNDDAGKEQRPSEIIDQLLRLFPNLTVKDDVISREVGEDLIGGRTNTLRHLTRALQAGTKGEPVDGIWNTVMQWYQKEDRALLEQVLAGLYFTNKEADLPKELAELLYKRDQDMPLTISPSRLERFSRCPFAHFVMYGLNPKERRVFEAAGREIGDIYHLCLKELTQMLTEEGKWETVTEEECKAFVDGIAEEKAKGYREGVFHEGKEEQYKLRRLKDVCFSVCWALIEQVRAGTVEDSRYEAPFGRSREFQPIAVDCGDQTVFIEGIIDRVDMIPDQRVKIIDYKTGEEKFNVEEARGGYRLQLMLYLKAAQEQQRKPAGVFYFLIDEPKVDLTEFSDGNEPEKISEKILKEMKKFFKLNGIMVNDRSVIDGIAGDFEGYSDIVPLRKTADGIKGTSEQVLLSEEDFLALQEDMDRKIRDLCRDLTSGRIQMYPKKVEKQSACTHCKFHSICRFDTAFEDCNYEVIL